jgi:hypothetical protein
MKGWYTTKDGLAEVTIKGNKANTELCFFNRMSDKEIEETLRLQGGDLTPEVCDKIVQNGEYPEGIIEEAAKKEWFLFQSPHKLYET